MINFIEKHFITGKNYTKQEERQKYATLSSIVSIIANLLLSISKIICGVIFHSISVLGDGINNLSDCGSSAVTFIGFKLSGKPADKEHPFGHDRIEHVSGFIVSFIVLFVGFELLLSSLEKVFSPVEVEPNMLTTFILAFSMSVKYWLYLFNKKIGDLINSNTIIGVAKDSFNDIFITLGVLVSSGVYYFYNVNIDGYVGVIIALLVAKSGYDLAKDTLSPIIGEAPDPEFIKDIYELIMKKEQVLGAHDLIVHTYGEEKKFASVHVEFDAKIEFMACHEIADEIERDFENLGIQVVVHCDPVVTDSKEFDEYKQLVLDTLNNIDANLNFHGFRYIKQENNIKLLFDIVRPNNLDLTTNELIDLINKDFNNINPKFILVIRVDENYNSFN